MDSRKSLQKPKPKTRDYSEDEVSMVSMAPYYYINNVLGSKAVGGWTKGGRTSGGSEAAVRW